MPDGERLMLPHPRTLLVTQVAYHAKVLLRTPRAVIGGTLLPVILLVVRGRAAHVSHAEQSALVAGVATFGVLSTAYVTHASSLVAARQAGILKRWRATPLPPWCFFAGRVIATTFLAVAGGVLTAVVGSSDYHLTLTATGLAELAGVLLLGAATWASVGTAVSALIPTVEAAWPLLGLTYLPVVILSGSFGGVHGEPGWLTTMISYLPVQPVIHDASRVLYVSGGGSPMTVRDLAVLAGWALGALLLSHRHFRWDPRTAGRRHGRSASPAPAVDPVRAQSGKRLDLT